MLIGGFIITGAQPKKVIIRAIGPSIPLSGALADPIVELRNSSGGLIAVNEIGGPNRRPKLLRRRFPPVATRNQQLS